MTDEPLDPLPTELRELLEAERTQLAPPPGSRARVAAKLALTLFPLAGGGAAGGGAAGGATGGSTAGASTAKAVGAKTVGAKLGSAAAAKVIGVSMATKVVAGAGLAALAVGGTVGVRRALAPEPPASAQTTPRTSLPPSGEPVTPPEATVLPPPRAAVTPTPAPAPSAPHRRHPTPAAPEAPARDSNAAEPTAEAEAAVNAATPAGPPTAEPPSRTMEVREMEVRETALLEAARAAMARGDANATLRALDELGKGWAAGVSAEERLALQVFALSRLNRTDEARTVAAEYLRRFPAGVRREAVEAAVAP